MKVNISNFIYYYCSSKFLFPFPELAPLLMSTIIPQEDQMALIYPDTSIKPVEGITSIIQLHNKNIKLVLSNYEDVNANLKEVYAMKMELKRTRETEKNSDIISINNDVEDQHDDDGATNSKRPKLISE